ncbi:MAG: ABC transporter substrate binding protein [Pseudomonadota bacterium]
MIFITMVRGYYMRFSLVLTVTVVLLNLGAGFPAAVGAKDFKVGVMWMERSKMANDVSTGLVQRLNIVAPQIELTIRGELPDKTAAERVFTEFEKTCDGIVCLRSDGAQFLGSKNPRVPSFVGACADPTELGVIKDPKRPEGNITGVTYHVPYEKRFRALKKLFPNAKNICLVAQSSHPAAEIERKETSSQCAAHGLGYTEVLGTDIAHVMPDVEKISSKVDVVITANTGFLLGKVGCLLPITNKSGVPMFAYSRNPVEAGAVAGLGADDMKMGALLGDSVVEVLVKGKPVTDVPVKTDPTPKLFINKSVMKTLGLNFSKDLLDEATLVD